MFEIDITPEAVDDLKKLRKYDRKIVADAIDERLPHEPDKESKNRKRLRPNNVAEWELRVGSFRVFYDVIVEEKEEKTVVRIRAVGKKRGNKILLHGKEYKL